VEKAENGVADEANVISVTTSGTRWANVDVISLNGRYGWSSYVWLKQSLGRSY